MKQEKRCPRCEAIKPLGEFPRNRAMRDGRGSYCKPCHNEIGRVNRERRHGSTRAYHLKARYGITESEFQAIVGAQGGLCAICRSRPPTHLDHCHEKGQFRGALCVSCNNGLGLFRDNDVWLEEAVRYLRRWD